MSQKIKTSVEIDGSLTASQIANATIDTDKFIVSDSGVFKYRTGSQMLSDLGITLDTATKLQHQVKAGVAINKGQAVYVTSADGTNMIVGLASNASEATSSKTMGLLNATVAVNDFADVITEGLLSGLNTSAATVGDPVWLGTSGNLIYGLANKPYAPNHLVFIGIVTRVNANNGEIFVKVQNGFELDELHNVDLKTTIPINGHILGYNGTLWVNKTIAGWLGYTPANDARTISTTSPLQGGGDLSASRTLSISQANSTTNGYLSFTDWNTFNGKANDNEVVKLTGDQAIAGLKTFTSAVKAPNFILSGGTGNTGLYYGHTNKVVLANYAVGGGIDFETNGGAVNMVLDASANLSVVGSVTASSIIKAGGTSTQFLKANGDLDSTIYTPASRILTINGTSYDLSANRSWTIPTHDAVTIGTANGLSLVGQSLSLGLASSINTGALSSDDWTTFNNKLSSLSGAVLTTTNQNIGGYKTFTEGAIILNNASNNLIDFQISGESVGNIFLSSAYTQFTSKASNGYLFKNTASENVLSIADSGIASFLNKVGIGTPSPAEKLEVNGNILLSTGYKLYGNSNSGTTSSFISLYNATDGGIDLMANYTTSKMTFGTAGSERMRIFSSGNVFIGSSPVDAGYKFFTNGVGAFHSTPGNYGTLLRLRDTVAANTESFGGVHFTSAPGSDYTIGKWTTAAGVGFLQVRDHLGNAFMTINASGNVGIGTVIPSTKLTVEEGISYGVYGPNKATISAVNTTTDGKAGFIDVVGYSGNTVSPYRWGGISGGKTSGVGDGNYGGYLSLWTTSGGGNGEADSASYERMRITSGGDVQVVGNRSIVLQGANSGTIQINGDGSTYATGIQFKSQLGGTALSGIWNYGSGTTQIWLALGGTAYDNAAMYIRNSNVLIGTTTDAGYKLDVNGTGRFSGTLRISATTPTQEFYSTGNGDVWGSVYAQASGTGSGASLVFSTKRDGDSATDKMIITQVGNVGIGATVAYDKLTLGGGKFYIAYASNSDVGATIYSYNNTAYQPYAGGLKFQVFRNETGAYLMYDAMTLDAAGRLAIGTTNNIHDKLHIQNGSAANTTISIQSWGTEAAGEYAGIRFKSATTATNEYGKGFIGFRNNGTGYGRGDLYFCLNNSTDASNAGLTDSKMVITSGGNVLIGTSPVDAGYKLDVNGTGRVKGQLTIEANSGTISGARNTLYLKNSSSSGNQSNVITLGSAGTPVSWEILNDINANGTTIGQLDFINNGGVKFTIAASGASTFAGTVTASGGFFNSDMRLKKLTDYDYNVSDIKPISYLWKDGRDNKKHVGYSAQEVQKVMPDAVNEGEDGMLSVNYIEVLVAQVNFLTKRIEELEKIVSK